MTLLHWNNLKKNTLLYLSWKKWLQC